MKCPFDIKRCYIHFQDDGLAIRCRHGDHLPYSYPCRGKRFEE